MIRDLGLDSDVVHDGLLSLHHSLHESNGTAGGNREHLLQLIERHVGNGAVIGDSLQ